MRSGPIRWLAVIAGGLAFYMIGFLWYGVLFMESWQTASGYSDAELADNNPLFFYIGGLMIPMLTAWGLAHILRWRGVPHPGAAVRTAALVWLGLGLPAAGYALVYSANQSWTLFFIDASHTLVGWSVAAAVIAILDKRPAGAQDQAARPA